MVFGFGGQDEEEDTGRQASPTSEVRRLASQGLSEQEIIDELRSKGYSNSQIKRSLNKVLKYQVSNQEGDAQSPARSPREGPSPEESFVAPPPSQESERERKPSPDISRRFEQGREEAGPVWEMTEEEEIELEELIEEMINEKWSDIEPKIDNLEKEKEELKKRVNEIEEKIGEVESKHKEEKEELEKKVDRTFSHIETIESRVGSVEKAFKEFLPTLTQNVRSLSGIVKDLKSETGRTPPPSSNVPSTPDNYLNSLPSEDSKESKEEEPSALE